MAENFHDKTEQPTEKRLREFKEQGKVIRSREFNTVFSLISAAAFIWMFGSKIGTDLLIILKKGLDFKMSSDLEIVLLLKQSFGFLFYDLFFLFILLFIGGIVPHFLVGGVSFYLGALKLHWDKINPAAGFKRLFSFNSLIEMFKSILKIVLLFLVTFFLIKHDYAQINSVHDLDFSHSITISFYLLAKDFLILSFALIVVSFVDLPYQMYTFHQERLMTKQEVRDEYKETEGNPEIKGRMRQLQRNMARQRMMDRVPLADVVVTNPEHFAVAIMYRQSQDKAPRVVAKGADLVAQKIKEVAAGKHIPTLRLPPLARSLYYVAELEKEIPAGLYAAIAQVLAYVYQLKAYHSGEGMEPNMTVLNEIHIPDEYKK